MTTTLAPDYRIEARLLGFVVLRNGLRVCTCPFRHDAERIAYCLRLVEESERSERVRG